MQVKVIDQQPPTILVDGEIDCTNSTVLREVLCKTAEKHSCIQLDLSGVDFIDSGGIGVLIEHIKATRRKGAEFRLIRLSRTVANVLFSLGLIEAFGIGVEDMETLAGNMPAQIPGRRWLVTSFTVPAISKAPSIIRNRVSEFVADSGLSQMDADNVNLAVGEAATNAVKYGRPHRGKGVISVYCIADDHVLVIEVSDSGPGFERSKVCIPDFSELPTGGMGIAIMEMVMDEVEFRSDGGTTVRMVKRLTPASSPLESIRETTASSRS